MYKELAKLATVSHEMELEEALIQKLRVSYWLKSTLFIVFDCHIGVLTGPGFLPWPSINNFLFVISSDTAIFVTGKRYKSAVFYL